MKAFFSITAYFLCFLLLSYILFPVSGTENNIITFDVSAEDTAVTLTVAMQATEITSLGLSVTYSDGLTLTDPQWLMSGLIVSFDTEKDKGVYSPGKDPVTIGGNIFAFTLMVQELSTNAQVVTVTVIGKHGTETVFTETVSAMIREAAILWGDADGDSYVDAYDASLIKKYSVGAIASN